MESYELEQEFVEYFSELNSKDIMRKYIAEINSQYLKIEFYGNDVLVARESRINRRTANILLPGSFALDLAKILIIAYARGLIKEELVTGLPPIKEFIKELSNELKETKPKKVILTEEAEKKIQNGDYYVYYYKWDTIRDEPPEEGSNEFNYKENVKLIE